MVLWSSLYLLPSSRNKGNFTWFGEIMHFGCIMEYQKVVFQCKINMFHTRTHISSIPREEARKVVKSILLQQRN